MVPRPGGGGELKRCARMFAGRGTRAVWVFGVAVLISSPQLAGGIAWQRGCGCVRGNGRVDAARVQACGTWCMLAHTGCSIASCGACRRSPALVQRHNRCCVPHHMCAGCASPAAGLTQFRAPRAGATHTVRPASRAVAQQASTPPQTQQLATATDVSMPQARPHTTAQQRQVRRTRISHNAVEHFMHHSHHKQHAGRHRQQQWQRQTKHASSLWLTRFDTQMN